MISLFIFILHLIFFIWLFRKISKKESYKNAFLNLILVILIFTIGWSLTAMLVKLLLPLKGLSKELTNDTISLLILSVSEFFIYRFYYKDIFSGAGKGK